MDIQPLVTGPGSTFLQSLQLPSTIANTQANTALTQAQATAAGLANQKTSMLLSNMPSLMSALNTPPPGTGTPGSGPSTSGVPIGQTGVDGDDIQEHAFQKYAALPTARPAWVTQKIAYATPLYGAEQAEAMFGKPYDQSIAEENQNRMREANLSYLTAASVATAPAGSRLATLNRYNPQAAAQLEQRHPSDDPAELDADALTMAQHIGANVHQYSGRKTSNSNGVFIDDDLGAPVIGQSQVLTGLDAAGKAKAYNDATEPVTLGPNLAVPRWQAAGAASPESYVIAADRAARSSATQPPAAVASQPVAAAPQPPPAVPQASDPVLRNALGDAAFRYQPPPKPTDQPTLAAATDQAKANVAAQQTLKTDADDATKAAAQAQTYLMAAKSIMDNKGANVGAYGGLIAKASSLMPGQSVDATNYQEVAKYLGNAALANARGIYGNRMTQSEVGLQLNELSPSVKMTDTAINGLLNTNLKAAQYTIDSAGRVIPYLSAHNDPTNFAKWNQKYWNQAQNVNTSDKAEGTPPAPARSANRFAPENETGAAVPTATGPNGQKLYLRNGQWSPQ